MFAVLLDTCVLWPSLQRDFLLSLGAEGLYRPLWSERILQELQYGETSKLTERGADHSTASAQATRLTDQMTTAFDDALVHGRDGLEGTYDLPDPNDEHVLAAAVMGGAGAIITSNTKDFPAVKLPPGLNIIRPETCAANTVALNPHRALTALTKISSRYRHPSRSVDDLLGLMVKRYNMIDVDTLLRPLL